MYKNRNVQEVSHTNILPNKTTWIASVAFSFPQKTGILVTLNDRYNLIKIFRYMKIILSFPQRKMAFKQNRSVRVFKDVFFWQYNSVQQFKYVYNTVGWWFF